MHDDESRLESHEMVLQMTLIREATGSCLTMACSIELQNLEYVVLTRYPGWKVHCYESAPF